MLLNFYPADKPEAIWQILIMLLVAALIGFLLAWILKNWLFAKRQAEYEARISGLEGDLGKLKGQIGGLEKDMGDLRGRNHDLSVQLDDCLKSKASGAAPKAAAPKAKVDVSGAPEEVAARLGVRPASSGQKDDLTRISGVGNFIEKKLNNLGIYTFEQISHFDSATIERVTDAIEFFPGRIERDNWVSQAADFFKEKSS